MITPRIATLAAATVVIAVTFCLADGARNGEKDLVSQAFELRMAGKVDAAKLLLAEVLAEDPKDAAAHFEMARAHFYTMELDHALREVEAAVALRPHNARYHHLKGMTEEYNMILKAHDPKTRGDVELLAKKSLESLRRAVKLEPKDHEARLQLINLCLKMPPEDGGGRDEAEKLVKQAEALDAIVGAKARCMLLGRRAKQQQRDVWEKEVAKQPNSAGAHEGLGRALLLLGDTDKAIRHLDKALTLDPARRVILVDLASHYFFAKEYHEVERTAKRYLDFKPGPAVPMRAYGTFMVARIHKVQGHHERAEELLVQARKIDPHLWQTVGHPPELLFTAPYLGPRPGGRAELSADRRIVLALWKGEE
jgi:tetratricopeptide (TPR) repeat protein